MHRRSTAASLFFAASVLVLGACAADPATGRDPSPRSAPSTAQSAPARPQSGDAEQSARAALSEAEKARQEAGTRPIGGDAWVSSLDPLDARTGDSPMVLHGLRVGEHEGFYRVVVEFTGDGTPGYFQSWADTPVEQGRGRELPVTGTSYLDLVLTGTSMPVEESQQAEYYSGPKNLSVGPLDVREDGTFEDTTHIVIGMDRPREFQIGFLSDPVRAVIDVKK